MSTPNALRTVYRALMRYTRQLQQCNDELIIRAPLDRSAYERQRPTWTVNDAGIAYDAAVRDVQSAVDSARLAGSRQDTLKQLLPPVIQAFAALRVLSEQMYLQQCSSHTVTHGISVDVTSAFTEKVDLGGAEAYSFIYRVRITNIGDHRAQLLSRHWVIRDANGNIANEVKGPGVIGNTPLLKPYDCFEYYSATFSRTQQGSMGGAFQMLQISPESHKHFDALIQPFKLIAR